MIRLSGVLYSVPGGALSARAIVAALFEWQRKSELSADRAGLLATQDPAVAFRVHMKLACGSGDLSELDQTSFFAQGQEYLDSSDLRDSVLKLLLIEEQSHPFAVLRAAELRRWVDSGEYTQILGGAYPRRDEDASAKMTRRGQGGRGQLHRDLQGDPGRARQAGPRRGRLLRQRQALDRRAAAPQPRLGRTATRAATGTGRGAPNPGCGGQRGA